MTSVKVIDMTGPKQRVLSSYEEIHDRHSRPDENMPTSGKCVCLLLLAVKVCMYIIVVTKFYPH